MWPLFITLYYISHTHLTVPIKITTWTGVESEGLAKHKNIQKFWDYQARKPWEKSDTSFPLYFYVRIKNWKVHSTVCMHESYLATYCIAQNFGGVNFFGGWSLKIYLNGNILAVEHNTGCCVMQCNAFGWAVAFESAKIFLLQILCHMVLQSSSNSSGSSIWNKSYNIIGKVGGAAHLSKHMA